MYLILNHTNKRLWFVFLIQNLDDDHLSISHMCQEMHCGSFKFKAEEDVKSYSLCFLHRSSASFFLLTDRLWMRKEKKKTQVSNSFLKAVLKLRPICYGEMFIYCGYCSEPAVQSCCSVNQAQQWLFLPNADFLSDEFLERACERESVKLACNSLLRFILYV